jgi:hypothetical protein
MVLDFQFRSNKVLKVWKIIAYCYKVHICTTRNFTYVCIYANHLLSVSKPLCLRFVLRICFCFCFCFCVFHVLKPFNCGLLAVKNRVFVQMEPPWFCSSVVNFLFSIVLCVCVCVCVCVCMISFDKIKNSAVIPICLIERMKQRQPKASYCALTRKGKAIPLQAWTDPEGSRRLRLKDFKTVGTWRC